MSYRLHPDAAWLPKDDRVYAMALPDGDFVALEGTAAVIFLDVAAGGDPVEEGVQRWGELARDGVAGFLEELIARRLILEVDDTQPRAESTAGDGFSILFVCTANICRSSYAELAARVRDVPGISFASAGTHALVGHPVDPPMAEELRRRGLDPSIHAARQLTGTLVEAADLVLVMSPRHRSFILEEWPGAARKTFLLGHAARVARDLPDDPAPEDLPALLWDTRTSGHGEAVADPFGKGRAAARACAERIDIFVADILEALDRRRRR